MLGEGSYHVQFPALFNQYNLSSCQVMGALWSSSSQLPGVLSSSFLLTIWGLALSRLPPHGARYPTPTGCPNAGSHLLHHKILILPAPLRGKEVQRQRRGKGSWRERFAKVLTFWGLSFDQTSSFWVPRADPTTLREPPSLPCLHSQRGCFLTWHFWANNWWSGDQDSWRKKSFVHITTVNESTCSKPFTECKTLPKGPSSKHCCTAGQAYTKERHLFLYLHPIKSFERLTPW